MMANASDVAWLCCKVLKSHDNMPRPVWLTTVALASLAVSVSPAGSSTCENTN